MMQPVLDIAAGLQDPIVDEELDPFSDLLRNLELHSRVPLWIVLPDASRAPKAPHR